MDTKIREYINEMFVDAPKTKKALEMKEEMIANAEEKFNDMITEGYQEEDAFAVVIHSIGNVEELFQELKKRDGSMRLYSEEELSLQQKKARYTAIAVGLYIFAGAVFFTFQIVAESLNYAFDIGMIGFVITALICIVPTVMLVYVSQLAPKYRKNEDTMVEEYKEWKSGNNRYKEIRRAVSCIIWTLAIMLYFLVSFTTMAWYITWVIFLIAACAESIVQLVFSMKR